MQFKTIVKERLHQLDWPRPHRLAAVIGHVTPARSNQLVGYLFTEGHPSKPGNVHFNTPLEQSTQEDEATIFGDSETSVPLENVK